MPSDLIPTEKRIKFQRILEVWARQSFEKMDDSQSKLATTEELQSNQTGILLMLKSQADEVLAELKAKNIAFLAQINEIRAE